MRHVHAAALGGTFLVLGSALFLLNGRYAYHPTDDGFVLAYAWRVLHGEIPYRDFLYVRTPLSPYLHVGELLLPDGWAIQAGRLTFYLELALAGALPTMWAAIRLRRRPTARTLALAAIFFLFAVHNFPPMPWPTVDGVMLATASVTAVLFSFDAPPARKVTLRVIASILVALAVLAKQSFAPLALLFAIYASVEAVRERSPRPLASALLPGALVGIGVLTALAAGGALPELMHQVLEPARLRPSSGIPWSGDLLTDGVAPYLRSLDLVLVVIMFAAFVLGRWAGAGRMVVGRVASLVVLAGLAALAIEAQSDVFTAGRQLALVLLALVVGGLPARTSDDRQAALALAALLAVGWCASLSFAYQTPLLGLGAVGVFVERILSRVVWPAGWLAVALAAGVVTASVISLDLDQPYRDLPRSAQLADLGEIYPRFGRLYTNPANADRFRELRDLSQRYAIADGNAFVVLPDYPLIHYLSGTANPLSIDWVQPQEYVGREARLSAELADRRPTVIIEREPGLTVGTAVGPPSECPRPPDTQALVVSVAANWTLVAEGRHFCVYRAP